MEETRGVTWEIYLETNHHYDKKKLERFVFLADDSPSVQAQGSCGLGSGREGFKQVLPSP